MCVSQRWANISCRVYARQSHAPYDGKVLLLPNQRARFQTQCSLSDIKKKIVTVDLISIGLKHQNNFGSHKI